MTDIKEEIKTAIKELQIEERDAQNQCVPDVLFPENLDVRAIENGYLVVTGYGSKTTFAADIEALTNVVKVEAAALKPRKQYTAMLSGAGRLG